MLSFSSAVYKYFTACSLDFCAINLRFPDCMRWSFWALAVPPYIRLFASDGIVVEIRTTLSTSMVYVSSHNVTTQSFLIL